MLSIPVRVIALAAALVAAAALGVALASEYWGGLVPCALCLVERWPFRIAIVLCLLAIITPPRLARGLLVLAAVAMLTDAAIAFVHVGVEFKWWASPLPECAAPRMTGGSATQILAALPARPAKPCDEPTFLISFLPVSMAMMNLLFGLVFAGMLAMFVWRSGRRPL